jgi:oxepin-CoA hydrolase/3-oxo-5,6-dehydrosuberyl-CoA semialdehyde dehydrogenase
MGPVASKAQLADVRGGIQALAQAADVLCGGAEPVLPKGWFVRPTLLRARDARAPVINTVEVFGPVATVVPFDGGATEAVELCNLGGGGLVASVYGDDKAFLDAVLLGIAPWHGRVYAVGEKVAAQALAPGMVLPATIHGGPGRAGGGEELGALRGLQLYLQRTAFQGDVSVLKAFGPAARPGGG